MAFNKSARKNKIKMRIRAKVFGTAARPRLSVFRSNTAIYVQLIDDSKGHTLLSVSSRDKNFAGVKCTKTEMSAKVGKSVAENALAKGINAVVFDRGGNLYHGRVKALAEAAREGGLNF